MNKEPVEAVQAHKSSNQKFIRHSSHLKPGSPVLVRIINKTGKNNYEASVAGVRIILSSEKNLTPGETFKGIIGLENGAITITPADTKETIEASIKTFSFENLASISEPALSPSLTALLSSLGLPPDNLSFQILLQMRQLGMKFDSLLGQKIRRKVETSSDYKKEIEKSIISAQKKIADLNSVTEYESSFFEDPEKEKQNRKQDTDNFIPAEIHWKDEILHFLEEITSETLENKPGKLTLMNHIGFFKNKTSENTWINIPFEITNPFEDKVTGNGKFLILLGSSDKNFKQMNIQINFKDKRYRFILGTQGSSKKIKRIRYAVESDNGDISEEDLQLEAQLKKLCQDVQKVPFSFGDGTAMELESFEMVETEA